MWSALRDVGAMLSLIFFYAIFANCSHSAKFHASLKRHYFRHMKKEEEATEALDKRQKHKREKEFARFFSFQHYMDLNTRVLNIERALQQSQMLEQ